MDNACRHFGKNPEYINRSPNLCVIHRLHSYALVVNRYKFNFNSAVGSAATSIARFHASLTTRILNKHQFFNPTLIAKT